MLSSVDGGAVHRSSISIQARSAQQGQSGQQPFAQPRHSEAEQLYQEATGCCHRNADTSSQRLVAHTGPTSASPPSRCFHQFALYGLFYFSTS